MAGEVPKKPMAIISESVFISGPLDESVSTKMPQIQPDTEIWEWIVRYHHHHHQAAPSR